MQCADILEPSFLLFSNTVPPLLYYSHFFALFATFSIGIFVYVKNPSYLRSKFLLLSMIFFSLWLLMDVFLWVNVDSAQIMFIWSIINLFEVLVSVSLLYFSYLYFEKRDVPFKYKLIGGVLLLPLIASIPTDTLFLGFSLDRCEAIQGLFLSYYHLLEGFFSGWLFLYLLRKIVIVESKERQHAILFSLGVFLFLFSFSGTNVMASITENWNILHYGLFTAPLFVGMLSYLIVRYHTFGINKLLGSQVLIAGVILLIVSQYFFQDNLMGYILTGITLILTLIMSLIFIRSIKRDIERKEELQEISDSLALANQELKRLDNAKSEFISIASHQLRTPLTAIKGYASLILEGSYGKIDTQLQDVVNKIYVANGRLIELVENLLSISRLESGKMQYNFQPTHLEEMVQDLGNMFSVIARKRGLEFSVVLPETPLPVVTVDGAKIREVMSNLIDNAIKYTEKGSVTVSVWQEKDFVRYSVKDTGIGFDAEDKGRLFLKFSRSKETERLYVGGTGLGLYVGKTFLEKHGGRIWAESDGHGRGSEFSFELPISRDSL